MINAVIDHQAFEQLVAGKPVTIQGLARTLETGNVEVQLILSDIGFPFMFQAIQKAIHDAWHNQPVDTAE